MSGVISLFGATDDHCEDLVEVVHGPALQVSQSCRPLGAWHAAHFLCFLSNTDRVHLAERDSFVCVGTYDRKSGKIGDAPEEYAVPSGAAAPAADSGKGVAGTAATGKGKSAATAAPSAASG